MRRVKSILFSCYLLLISSGLLFSQEMNNVPEHGSVDAADLIRVINIINGIGPAPTPEELAAVDMNSDGKIDVSDLMAMISIILGNLGSWPLRHC